MLVSHSVYDIVYIVNIVFFKDCKLYAKLYRLKPTADHVPITLHSLLVGQLAKKFLFYFKGLLIVINQNLTNSFLNLDTYKSCDLIGYKDRSAGLIKVF